MLLDPQDLLERRVAPVPRVLPVVLVCLVLRVLLDSVVLLVCPDREEREVSLACLVLLER